MEMEIRFKFYSWKDIERFFFLTKEKWFKILAKVEVYPSEIILYKNENTLDKDVKILLEELLPLNFSATSDAAWEICLDFKDTSLPIFIDDGEEYNYPVTPIFKDILYRNSSYTDEDLPLLKTPVIAFHSYKGGVGRTLSLLAFAKAWSELFADTKGKLLIIDADIEAPGITWLNKKNIDDASFSYLDLLDILQGTRDIHDVVKMAASKLQASYIDILADKKHIQQIFMPTYRYKEQLIDIYATPDTIAKSKGKKYALTDTLSHLGSELGVAAVLVDLRAGLSDYSSTLLFDRRVKKYLVTTTSEQSVMGTELLLGFLKKGLTIKQDTLLPEILLNMVTGNLNDTPELEQITDRLKASYYEDDMGEDENFVDNFLTQLRFASELIHLSSLEQIFIMLSDRDMFKAIKDLVKMRYDYDNVAVNNGPSTKKRQQLLTEIYGIAKNQLVAESDNGFNVLITKSLQNLLQKHISTIPQIVITGAKGAGKTFLYKKMLQAKSWKSFGEMIQANSSIIEQDAFFLPVLSTSDFKNMKDDLKESILCCAQNIQSVYNTETPIVDNIDRVKEFKDRDDYIKESDWKTFWNEFLAKAINPNFSSLQEANDALKKDNKKIIILIDGLEEIFTNVGGDKKEKMAISTLCRDTINQLTTKYSFIGAILFLRYDMAQDAMPVNFTQFMSIYEKFSLQWSQEEALRLALWLVKQAHPNFVDESVDIVSASRDVIEQCLTKLWGLKLGKNSSNEAYTSRWVLATLSDFNGQLQARDIIRFLKHAAKNGLSNAKPPYEDRYIMPQEIKNAVIQCSEEKIDEIKAEYYSLRPIFEKLSTQSQDTKTLPLTETNNPLDAQERESMENAGFLKKDKNKYYLPEIIRHALEYKYERGARPRVLSLLLKK